MEHVAVNPWAMLAYLVAGICFIMALRGLSSPSSSRHGNRFGMAGMAIAVATTLLTHAPGVATKICPIASDCWTTFAIDWTTAAEIAGAILIGAAIGLTTARRIK